MTREPFKGFLGVEEADGRLHGRQVQLFLCGRSHDGVRDPGFLNYGEPVT